MGEKRRKGEKVKKGGSRKRRRVAPRVDGGCAGVGLGRRRVGCQRVGSFGLGRRRVGRRRVSSFGLGCTSWLNGRHDELEGPSGVITRALATHRRPLPSSSQRLLSPRPSPQALRVEPPSAPLVPCCPQCSLRAPSVSECHVCCVSNRVSFQISCTISYRYTVHSCPFARGAAGGGRGYSQLRVVRVRAGGCVAH